MLLSNTSADLPFLEYCLINQNGEWDVIMGQYEESSIDFKELNSYVKGLKQEMNWLDFNSISSDHQRRNLQLDLLGHSNEPAVLYKLSTNNDQQITFYLIKLKPFLSPEDLFYGRDQKYLIEKIIKLWLISNSEPKNSEINTEINFKYLSLNQDIKIDNLNNDLNNAEFSVYKTVHQLYSVVVKSKLASDQKLVLTKECLDWFKNYKGSADSLETQINDAFEIAKALHPTRKEIIIQDYYFLPEVEQVSLETTENVVVKENIIKTNETLTNRNFNQANRPDNEKIKPQVSKSLAQAANFNGITRLEKTIFLLDRYNKAVESLLIKGIPILGKNIAAECSPPISAPALTDSIQKHKDRILQCFKDFPDRWSILKDNYQVIRNMTP
jgi:hypothetical protein